ncbi:MAG TPA: bifunctional 5,10-methylenetetrahydrofolate dehydrogenase/5,10-methenyltetrahydrofolate cyclohydrolase [Candidatus Paceibacterota bacterium]|nr:bifunctional 5,10-methylenetetrahydrofolate dehydrogenase/5,10-methenyltetrahydrofolate cyclohydrolase [Candidatus Paceibacterota bacterium]
MTQIIDGRAIAEDLYKELETRRARFAHAPRLGILVGLETPLIESYVRIKSKAAQRLGVELVRIDLQKSETTARAISAVRTLALETDGVVVQLPLPEHVDTNATLSSIPDNKDVDSISTATPEHDVDAPVALAVMEILRRSHVEQNGARVVVVGNGRLVGAPVAATLKRAGADVTVVTLESGSLADLKHADIVVLGAGSPGLVKPAHVKEGVVLIDAGTSEQGGKVVGDADPACADVASVFTPVPGGVGPIAVAMLFKNLFDLMEKK